MTQAMATAAIKALPVGDERRPRLGRSIMGSLLVAGGFEAFVFGVKAFRPLGDHAPWMNDPFDVATSFAIFFVPLLVALCAIRLPLARRLEPLPLSRAVGLLRACRLLTAVMAITILSYWVAVAVGADRSAWSQATPGLICGLVILTALVAFAGAGLERAGHAVPPPGAGSLGPDWLADALSLAERWSRRLGPLAGPSSTFLSLVDRRLGAWIRARPVTAAAVLAAAFGLSLAAAAAQEEGAGPVLLVFAVVGCCGMFVFLVVAGAYLDLVHRTSPALSGPRRRAAIAAVVASASLPPALGFRDTLWALVGLDSATAGLADLAVLLAVVAVLAFGLTFAVERAIEMAVERSIEG
ncbi:MAG: hypothetical protein EPN50_10100 [Chloroflexota bacterium]|nr:MAG: hypothetical protein EPN50_10100 [Chloroflexota bacterium]